MRARLISVGCTVTVDGAVLEHDAMFEASWRERRSWPTAKDGKDIADFSILKVLGRP
jgi:hypothetical protein